MKFRKLLSKFMYNTYRKESNMTTKPIIEVKDLVKKFGHKIANDHISFSIQKGERVGIIGANGAGKTTLVEQIIGTSKPTAGEIIYGFEYKKTPQEKMGMQFQTSSYPEGLTVKDVIDFSLDIYGSTIKQKDLEELLKVFQIHDFYKAKAKGLSGGQQQKLNVLLAIAHNPELVILDEISTGLDILAREEIVGYVDKITRAKNMTTILISHHMSEIEMLCDRVIILSQGKIKAEDSINNIQKKHGSLGEFMKEIIGEELRRDNSNE